MTELALAAIDPHKRQASMSKRSAVLMVAQLSTLISWILWLRYALGTSHRAAQ